MLAGVDRRENGDIGDFHAWCNDGFWNIDIVSLKPNHEFVKYYYINNNKLEEEKIHVYRIGMS